MWNVICGIKQKCVVNLEILMKKFSFLILRFIIYGMAGVFAEVCHYSIVKIGRMMPLISWAFKMEWRVDEKLGLNAIWEAPWYVLYGQCSLWMFPVYGLCSIILLEKIYDFCKGGNLNWLVRGIFYSFSIMAFELIAGFILWGITGYKIWYYVDQGSVFKMTSLYLFFVWFATGFLVEFVYRGLSNNVVVNQVQKQMEGIIDFAELRNE